MITRLSDSTASVFQRRAVLDCVGRHRSCPSLRRFHQVSKADLRQSGPGGQACEDPREERPREEVERGHGFDVTPDVAPFLAAFDQSQRDGPARMQHVAPEGVDQLGVAFVLGDEAADQAHVRGAVLGKPLLHRQPELGARVAEVGRIELGELPGDHRCHQRDLVRVAPVDRGLAHARCRCDGLHAHPREAELGEEPERRRLDRVADVGVEWPGHFRNVTGIDFSPSGRPGPYTGRPWQRGSRRRRFARRTRPPSSRTGARPSSDEPDRRRDGRPVPPVGGQA